MRGRRWWWFARDPHLMNEELCRMDIDSLEQRYRSKVTSPSRLIADIYAEVRKMGERPLWISVVSEEASMARALELESMADTAVLPLFGIPFAVKDNFDVEGLETTAACPEFSYTARSTAEAVRRLLDAGAILIGKTNMDQFATGLVGTRTPYGICSSVFDEEYISGGSSAGSAVAVANGLVSLALGTDTAGSGRVPAAFNQLVGLKPTRGLVSTMGLLPACRTLDCVSVFAETCSDAARVLGVIAGFDKKDAYSRVARPGEGAAPWTAARFRFGVPTEESREFFGDDAARGAYVRAIEALSDFGGEAIKFDYSELREAACLLYGGPWVAERLAAVREFAQDHSDAFDETVGSIIKGAERFSAVDGFQAAYRLQAIRRKADVLFNEVDFLLLPTAPTTYKISEVLASPIALNSNLGYYTNFVNLLDLTAVAVPAGMLENGLPFGVSLIGKAFADEGLLIMADRLHRKLASSLGGSKRLLAETRPIDAGAVPHGCVLMAVVGAHLSGEPLNWQMTERRGRLVRTVRSHADYRLYVLPDSTPAKPGLVFDPGYRGAGVELEVWAMPVDTVGSFLMGIPAPLCLGTVRLEDGSMVKGFLCEAAGVIGAEEITESGGWRNYLQSLSNG
jgi:allophanate hydrolase